MKKLHQLSLALVLAVSGSVFSSAQTSKGILTGVVRDPSGAVIAHAAVTVTNKQTAETRTVETASDGTYRLDALTPGLFHVDIKTSGFASVSADDVRVVPSLVATYDAILSVGSASETVSVEASTVTLNTENGSLAGTISMTELATVPIFSLNPIELATTVPGVQIVRNSGFSNGQNIQVSGARPRANNFLIDGQEINDISIAGQAVQPQIAAMYSDEVVYTHNPPAEYGRASGGVVNLITQGGTNVYHGSAWERYDASGLNSIPGNNRGVPGYKNPRYDEHTYGFTAGGPIWKDKLFAFGAGQWQRYYGQQVTGVYLNLPDNNGIALLQQIAAGSNATTKANAALLLSILNNGSYLNNFSKKGGVYQTRSLGSACPGAAGSCSITTGQYQRPSENSNQPSTQWTYRIDFNPTAKDNFFGRYLHSRSSYSADFSNNGSALPGYDSGQGGPSELGQIGWTHILTPKLLNEFRVAETRINFQFFPLATTLANPNYSLPQLSFGGTGGISTLGFPTGSFPQGRIQDAYQFQDTVSYTKGKHTIRVGGDIGRQISILLVALNTGGTLNFTATGSGGGSVGNFLLNQLGASGSANRTFGNTRLDLHLWRLGGFAQDDYRITPNLTLNIGARYDYFTPPENALNFPAIDIGNLYGAINTRYAVGADKNDIAPRFGFSYTPNYGGFLGDGKTVIRGGFGVFFDSDFTNIAYNSASSSPNAVAGTLTSTATNGLPNALSLIGSITPTLNQLSSVTSIVDNIRSPYTYEYNLGVERQVGKNALIGGSYVGTRGLKLYANQQYNYFNYSTGTRLNTTRGAIVARGNFADSQYHGLETFARFTTRKGLLVNATYTYSKSLDDSSEVFTTSSSPTSYAANLAPGGQRADWGNSAYDHRHFGSVLYSYTIPGFHSSDSKKDFLLQVLTRDWTVSGTSQFQSGTYSTINVSGIDTNGDGSTANDRPISSNTSLPYTSVGIDGYFVGGTPGVYYDLAANNTSNALNPVTASQVRWLVPHGPFGSTPAGIGRNSFSNPGAMYNNLALQKGFSTAFARFDRGRLVLRAEAQNVANHNNIGILDNNLLDVGTSSFQNRINARGTLGRSLILWAKFQF